MILGRAHGVIRAVTYAMRTHITRALLLLLFLLPASWETRAQSAGMLPGAHYGILIEPLGSGNSGLCAINSSDGPRWFWLNAPHSGMNEPLGTIEAAFFLVDSIKASPDGRYLAVMSVGEGHPIIEVVDLPQLLKQQQYTVLHSINPYPGVAYLEGWQGAELHIASDMLLTHRDPVTGDMPENFMLAGDEVFGLNVVTGAIRGVSEGAQSPAKHYSRILMDPLAGDSSKMQALTGLLSLEQHELSIEDLFKMIEQEENPERLIKLLEVVEQLRQQSAVE